MSINYPTGSRRVSHVENTMRTGKTTKKALMFGKRGMGLEEEINLANDYYLVNHLAVIHKKPTPVTIVKVDYPARSAAKITEAYFKQASTTDYNGVYQGRYIDFDAKETKNKTSFPLKNLHAHQIVHLANILAQGGIGFVIIKFTSLNETYVYPAKELIAQWQKLNGKQSISYDEIVGRGYSVPASLSPSLDYLKAVDQYFEHLN
ncbi:Holliday junction resolvase RecU [Leuconostoc carnosum]|uniref:Holliday junction resolvase RecU n=1 Tax=Leuconostoc carnosum TaxID=1252 RepID=UPI001238DF22|nr:Holliday junction resolvase RecU [Leuconostoc carnosum]KAA8371056.1 Holliday junction resolvase RecU [Leuconostoc carnosum]KAA8382697.1 Holliday junction resolvase RecU [Leuconostoc carnosum]